MLECNSSYTEYDLGQTCEINSTVVIELVSYFCSRLTRSTVDGRLQSSYHTQVQQSSDEDWEVRPIFIGSKIPHHILG